VSQFEIFKLRHYPKNALIPRPSARGADETRARILSSAKELFGQHGIDAVTIAQIAEKSGVAGSTVYAVFKSKEGILRDLMEQSVFGGQFQAAKHILAGVGDPAEAIARTSHVSRAIYESERIDLGLMRSIDDCEAIKDADAYNRCLASLGPTRGERGATYPGVASEGRPQRQSLRPQRLSPASIEEEFERTRLRSRKTGSAGSSRPAGQSAASRWTRRVASSGCIRAARCFTCS